MRHWVPAERLRLAYFLRWFYWSGVTHARLARRPGAAAADVWLLGAPRHLWRSALAALPVAAARLVTRGSVAAVERLTEGAVALGYLREHFRGVGAETRAEPSAARLRDRPGAPRRV